MNVALGTHPRLSLKGICCQFNSTVAVDHLNLDIQSGEFISLLGPSGCGKTTTLRMIAGFIDPTSGTIEMDGAAISTPGWSMPPERRNMSMIFQSYAIWPNMTVAQNVAFGLELRRLDRETVKKKVRDVLDTVQLTHLIDRYPAELSGGQQQRVALARAVVIEPRILLLDEPLSNLDANLREEMRFEIRLLHDKFKFTTIYVTHDQSEAMVTSDRIAVMYNGRIEQIDTPYAIYNRPQTRFVAGFIGRTNFVEGRRHGDLIELDGFALPVSSFRDSERLLEGKIVFSVRPQTITLRRTARPSGSDPRLVPAKITQRVYCGDVWDYVVALNDSGLRLRLSAPPAQMFEMGEDVWIEFDPQQMVPIG